jgi:hypothetical protein
MLTLIFLESSFEGLVCSLGSVRNKIFVIISIMFKWLTTSVN